MSFCCSKDLPERIRSLTKKSKDGFVKVFVSGKVVVPCGCGAPSEFMINYQNKKGGYVWPRDGSIKAA